MNAQPIIPWIGGKRRLADRLIPLFPQHSCYVEVFCGGAALFFLRPSPADVEVINDINGELVRLYRCVQHHLEEFVRQFKWALSSRKIFEWQQNTRPETLTDIQRAARFYYLQQLAFGGKVQGQTFGTATTTMPGLNLLRIEETLSAAHLRLANAYIENLSWEECVARYDRPHTFFYLDPPYWETEGYGVPFEFDNYVRMAKMAQNVNGKVMISLNDHPQIRECFQELHIETVGIEYSLGSRHGHAAERGELVITNYDPHTELGGLF